MNADEDLIHESFPKQGSMQRRDFKVAELPELVGSVPLVPGQDTADKAAQSYKIDVNNKASRGLIKNFGQYMK